MNPVLCEKKENIATVILNRPDGLNSLNWELFQHAIKVLDELAQDDSVRVVVLTGQGKGFCAGGDLSTIMQLKDTAQCRKFINMAGQMAAKLYDFPKPIIGMINGVAAGAGFNIALSCDIIMASDKARFAQSFAGVGLHPDMGGMYLLPRIVGSYRAKELMFTGQLINAQEAYDMGIVNHVIPAEELAEKTYDLARKLASSAPLALQLIKQALNRSRECTFETMAAIEVNNQVTCWASQDGQEGIKAFIEKRAPKFTGR